jgi:hypothetical protein
MSQTELDGACLRAQGQQQELPWYTDVTAEYSGLLKGVTALRVQKVNARSRGSPPANSRLHMRLSMRLA